MQLGQASVAKSDVRPPCVTSVRSVHSLIKSAIKHSRLAASLLVVLLATSFVNAGAQTNPVSPAPQSMSCHMELPPAKDQAPAQSILSGYGDGGFPIQTASGEAQAYFNNGMQLGHAFAHRSSAAAFRRAAQIDPLCAMCFWGEAWARGPSINFTIDNATQAELARLADHAAALAKDSPERERALIAALQERYKDGGGKGEGDQRYARAMDALAQAYPTDNEIAIMAADAWMIPASQENTQNHLDRVIQILEQALQRAPNNTGVIHLYIHATEMDGVAAEALPYAEKLEALAPAASHLVHMPSHTYFSVGRYQDAEQSNLHAVAIDLRNAERLKPQGGVFGLGYHDHNVIYGEEAALMDGDSKNGLALAASEVEQIPNLKPNAIFQQYELGEAYIVYGRYGSESDINGLADPGESLPFARTLWHYARSEAAVRRGDVAAAKEELSRVALTNEQSSSFRDSFPQASDLVDIAHLVLLGRTAMMEKHFSDAEALFRDAAEKQETKLATLVDPSGWWYPVRRSVAAALLAQGNYKAAMVEAKQALLHWPNDPVSLRILSDSETRLGYLEGAQSHLRLARSAWMTDIDALPLSLM
ncbi:hypothetical protein FTW19_00125 [Terriglobus albidus]|uniref:Tetratricopeptide repeat protein n=1 Tax=Terriglobus albidus TaxID=1592106 RepID=A0A5B9E2L2_9BACT|nr:hypothetical protein [Terriglobus albidus]QEE26552.1 hypothetical protein FTW19_00125 [Terriglobus albidus]